MELKTLPTEQMILEAAERIFTQKGYTATRTTEIAAAAGVNQALLHYYFRTKEGLFDRIFESKTSQMLDAFFRLDDSRLPFFDRLRHGIEQHFDFIAQNPAMPFFVIREMLQNDERKRIVREKIFRVAKGVIDKLAVAVQAEIDKGTIRAIHPQDLLLNIASLNVFSFIAMQIFHDVQDDTPAEAVQQFLEQRKRNNVETIINSIKL
jgi:AcrR family transcriptional regulator